MKNPGKIDPYIALSSDVDGLSVRLSCQFPSINRSKSSMFKGVEVHATHNYKNIHLNDSRGLENTGYYSVHKDKNKKKLGSFLYFVSPISVVENGDVLTKYFHSRIMLPSTTNFHEISGRSAIMNSRDYNLKKLKKEGSQIRGYLLN